MVSRIVKFALASLALVSTLPALNGTARASSGFVEAGFGVGRMSNTDSFFMQNGPASTGNGVAFDLTAFASLFGNATELQLGLVNKVVGGSNGGYDFTLDVPYPELRIQLSRVFFGAGYTPIVLSSSGGSISTLKAASGAKAMAFDAGVLFPIAPIFSMAAYGSLVNVSGAGTGPSAKEFGVLMRFYFTVSQSQNRSSSEFKGWRYPFGREK